MNVKSYKKTVTSKAWAKKNASKWYRIMATAGDGIGLSKERTPEDVVKGTPKVITAKGLENVYSLYINLAMDTVGANIGSQAWNNLTEKDILKMLNNIAKELGLKGYDSLEKQIKTDGLKIID